MFLRQVGFRFLKECFLIIYARIFLVGDANLCHDVLRTALATLKAFPALSLANEAKINSLGKDVLTQVSEYVPKCTAFTSLRVSVHKTTCMLVFWQLSKEHHDVKLYGRFGGQEARCRVASRTCNSARITPV